MSNNVNITPGTGDVVAAEDIGSVKYQKIKVVDGTAASSNAWKINSDGTAQVSVAGVVSVSQSGSFSTSIVGAVTLYAPLASLVSGVTSVITGTSSVLVLQAAPGGQRNYVTHIMATNAAAAGTFVNILDQGLIIYSGYAAASGGGFSATLPAPLRQPSTVSALYAATPTQASVVVAITGYTAT